MTKQSGQCVQQNLYYPFGGLYEWMIYENPQPYRYIGKELDRMYGLDWYDYGARMYDPGIGRFMTMDPLAHLYYNVSPYVYCLNNPVSYVDLDGKLVVFAEGVSASFKYSFKQAVAYLNQKGCGGKL